MTQQRLSAIWATVAPATANHLWQSTLFAIAAGLIIFTLRKNHARARYGLWLAASFKFLIPFSLLVNIGNSLATPQGHPDRQTGLYSAMEVVSQPFTQPTTSATSPVVVSIPFQSLTRLLPTLLLGIWLCGFVSVFVVWWLQWRRISAIVRKAVPVREGREWETLLRLEHREGTPAQIRLLLSRDFLEPGIFGIVRPALVWPDGISQRLATEHLEAILAHEISHVRRRDNLAAAIHMVIEALFWFHPLVWWLGKRLIKEREYACDEEVLRLGNKPQVYAESILKVREFCLRSPLACVAGVTGADLEERIVRIMTKPDVFELDFRKKLLLIVFGLAAVAMPI